MSATQEKLLSRRKVQEFSFVCVVPARRDFVGSILYAEVIEDKGIDIGGFVNDFGDGFARSMPGFGVDADKFGRVTCACGLQGGGILE